MITDEQGREWLLKKLYNNGWRYCVCMSSGNIYLTSEKPQIYSDGVVSIVNCKRVDSINGLKDTLFNKLKPNEILDIEEKLGIVDWSKVEVDTPVLVKQHEQDKWEKRHFAYFKDGRVSAWLCGATSWSADYEGDTTNWNWAKLAEV